MSIADIVIWSIIGFFIIGVGLVVLLLLFNKKGQKVQIRIFEEVSQNIRVEISPTEKIFGRIVREKNIEKLHIPKRFSPLPLEGVDPKMFILSDSSWPLVYLMKDAEGMFRPINVKFDDKKNMLQKVEDRDTVSWMMAENERLDRDYSVKDWWQTYGSAVILGGTVFFCLMAIFITGQQINEMTDSNISVLNADRTQFTETLSDIVNNINNNGQNTDVETSENAQRPPVG